MQYIINLVSQNPVGCVAQFTAGFALAVAALAILFAYLRYRHERKLYRSVR